MKKIAISKSKTHFSNVIEQVKAGEKEAVTFAQTKIKRKLGKLEGKAKVIFSPDFKMTEHQLLELI